MSDPSADLAVVLHDLAWVLPRSIGMAAMRAEPLPPTALEVMRLLARRPDLSVKDVGRELGVQANNISTAVTQLVGLGLIEKVTDGEDRRVIRLRLTQRALASRKARERSWAEAMEAALRSLPVEDAATLTGATAALRRLAEVLAG